ncbi:hypothetical protein [Arthrobacter sp. NPDC090010]|uniref:hypothetical protein n=1 Tax=Arthrobacter sp. NPDC090010 TaxID=3363942 RepID=UPI0037FC9220
MATTCCGSAEPDSPGSVAEKWAYDGLLKKDVSALECRPDVAGQLAPIRLTVANVTGVSATKVEQTGSSSWTVTLATEPGDDVTFSTTVIRTGGKYLVCDQDGSK